jgi:serine/threonine-protein kinase RsbW
MKLAVHEWLSNLIQHADFAERDPAITLQVCQNGSGVHCAIEDNSRGFDLDGRLTARSEILERFPERGMGLLMIKACTRDLRYTQLTETRHRLEFCVTAEHDPWLNIPF